MMDLEVSADLPAQVDADEVAPSETLSVGGGSRDPNDIALLCSLAVAHTLFGRHDTASSFLDLAGWIDPANRRVLELQAIIDMRRGRLDSALEAVSQLRDGGTDLPDELRLIEIRAAARSGT